MIILKNEEYYVVDGKKQGEYKSYIGNNKIKKNMLLYWWSIEWWLYWVLSKWKY